jgi:predicted Rossmann fold flavoprotein
MQRGMSATGPSSCDVLVLGAGAAGLFCAAVAGRRGRSVRVLDHARKPAEKVRISGGGRCNFTNLETEASRFISENPHFAKSALARYTPWDFLDLMSRHGLSWHEKTLGQLFCDQKSGAIIQMLLDEAQAGGASVELGVEIASVSAADGRYRVETSAGLILADSLVVATGGLSIPKMGATGLAYDIARQFGHAIIDTRPALVPFTFEGEQKTRFAGLSGLSCPVVAEAGGARFREAMLFTHRGLSGPSMLQVSSYWSPGEAVRIDLFDGEDASAALKSVKADHPMKTQQGALDALLPRRLTEMLDEAGLIEGGARLADLSHARLDAVAAELAAWSVRPCGTEGWRTAEVTAGGVDTAELSSKTMESRKARGLFFIGECVDVTGWLGGYNFQWAWASAAAAGEAA